MIVAMSLSLLLSPTAGANTFIFNFVPEEDPQAPLLTTAPGDVLRQPPAGNLDFLVSDVKNSTTVAEVRKLLGPMFHPTLSIHFAGCGGRYWFEDEWLCLPYNEFEHFPPRNIYLPAHHDTIDQWIDWVGEHGSLSQVDTSGIVISEEKARPDNPGPPSKWREEDDPPRFDPRDIPRLDELTNQDTLVIVISALTGEDANGLYFVINPSDPAECNQFGTWSKYYLDDFIENIQAIIGGAELMVILQTSWSEDFADAFRAAFTEKLALFWSTANGEYLMPSDGQDRDGNPDLEWRCGLEFSTWDVMMRHVMNGTGWNLLHEYIATLVDGVRGTRTRDYKVTLEEMFANSVYWTSSPNTSDYYFSPESGLRDMVLYPAHAPMELVDVCFGENPDPQQCSSIPEGCTWFRTNIIGAQGPIDVTIVTTENGVIPTQEPVDSWFYEVQYDSVLTGEPCLTGRIDYDLAPINQRVYLSDDSWTETQTLRRLPEGTTEINCIVPVGANTYVQVKDSRQFSLPVSVDVQPISRPQDDPDSPTITSSVEEEGNTDLLPTSCYLENYPQPFNPTTTIEFAVTEPGKVSLQVYNIVGQKVATLVNEHTEAGIHRVTFDGSDLPSGIYIAQLIGVNATFTRKLVLMK